MAAIVPPSQPLSLQDIRDYTEPKPLRLVMKEMEAWATSGLPTMFQLGRANGDTVIAAGLHGDGGYRWVTGEGIAIGDGLVNQSSNPIDLHVVVTDGQWTWLVDQLGRAEAFQRDAPPLTATVWAH